MTRRVAWILFAFLLAVFALGAQGGIVNPDAEVEFQTARSIWLRGSAGLSSEHADVSSAELGIVNHVPGPGRQGFDCMRGVDGKFYSWFGLGHALVIVPFYALGRGAAAVFPDVERAALENAVAQARAHGAPEALARAFAEDFFSHAFASFHSPLFAAGLGWILFLLLGHLGFSLRARVLGTLLACLTTQLFAGAREGMSDITAGFFLVACLERVLAWRFRRAGRGALVVAGALGGFSVLCRYGQLVPLVAIGIYVLWAATGPARGERACSSGVRSRVIAACRSIRWGDVLAFSLAALPFGIWLLWFNYARFGDVTETGYTAGTSEGYWNFPMGLGLLFLLAAPGKGALVFSPLLAFVPRGFVVFWRRARPEALVLLAILVLPWLLSSRMTGWHASQSWASRYMTIGAVVTIGLAVAALSDLALAHPSRVRWTRRVLPWIAALGFVINLGGNLAHYRGYYELGSVAWEERWKDIDPREDKFQRAVLVPRLSPALGHWLYAWETLRGRLPAAGDAGAASWKSVYGVVPRDETGTPVAQRLAYVEDRDFRHLWWIGWTARFGSWVPGALAALLAVLALAAGVRLRRFVTENVPGTVVSRAKR